MTGSSSNAGELGRSSAALAIVATISVGCGVPNTEYFGAVNPPVNAKHFRYCNNGEPESLDPALVSTTVAVKIVYSMFDGLTVFDYDGLPAASLATHWEISDDLRTFTFHLRDSATWSNGRAVDAYDVAYQALRVLSPATASPNADNYLPVKNANNYFANRVFVLQHDSGPYRKGQVVELVSVDGKKADEADVPDLGRRDVLGDLALRDLGKPVSEAFAHVPSGEVVTIIGSSGERALWKSPDGKLWRYVYWAKDQGLFGWVVDQELGPLPATIASSKFEIRRSTRKNVPGDHSDEAARAADEKSDRAVVSVTATALLRTFDTVGIDIPDAHTIVFETADPSPGFMTLTNNRAFRPTPVEAVSRSPRHWAEAGSIVTSGPMHLESWSKRNTVELVRSSTYWDPASVATDRISIFAIDDQAAATNYYYYGGCDAVTANTPPSTFLPILNGEKSGKAFRDYYVRPYVGVYFAWINTNVVSNRHLRRALAFAVDRKPIPTFTHGNENPSAQLSPGAPISSLTDDDLTLCGVTRSTPGVAMVMEAGKLCYVPPPGLDFDLAQAKTELALAKQEMGANFPSKLEYRYNAGSEAHKQIAEYLQQSWSAIGLTVELASQEWKSFVSDTREGKYQIARFGNLGNSVDTEIEFLPLFTCDSPDNRGKYCSADFDRLLAEARPLNDRNARNAKLREAERVMIEDAPVIPLYVYTQKQMQKPYVRNLAINAVDQPPLYKVWLDTTWRPGQAVPVPPGFSNPPVAMPAGSH
jgi:oligopeptide transport system substrate-binding protein